LWSLIYKYIAFQSTCSYITGQTDKYLLPGLTVYQTLSYEASLTLKVPSNLRKVRVRQILSDIALTQVAGVSVDKLTPSEKRRLAIGVHLIKDPGEFSSCM
jgi:ATP-binding cassette subfamily G (WHITE) protein 5 (sterolin 1)